MQPEGEGRGKGPDTDASALPDPADQLGGASDDNCQMEALRLIKGRLRDTMSKLKQSLPPREGLGLPPECAAAIFQAILKQLSDIVQTPSFLNFRTIKKGSTLGNFCEYKGVPQAKSLIFLSSLVHSASPKSMTRIVFNSSGHE